LGYLVEVKLAQPTIAGGNIELGTKFKGLELEGRKKNMW